MMVSCLEDWTGVNTVKRHGRKPTSLSPRRSGLLGARTYFEALFTAGTVSPLDLPFCRDRTGGEASSPSWGKAAMTLRMVQRVV